MGKWGNGKRRVMESSEQVRSAPRSQRAAAWGEASLCAHWENGIPPGSLTCSWYSRTGISSPSVGPNWRQVAEKRRAMHTASFRVVTDMLTMETRPADKLPRDAPKRCLSSFRDSSEEYQGTSTATEAMSGGEGRRWGTCPPFQHRPCPQGPRHRPPGTGGPGGRGTGAVSEPS